MCYVGDGKAIAPALNPGVQWSRAAQRDMGGPMLRLRPGLKLDDVFTLLANPLHQGIYACMRYFIITHRNPPFRGNTSEYNHNPSSRLFVRDACSSAPPLLFHAMTTDEVAYLHYLLYNIQTAFVKSC